MSTHSINTVHELTQIHLETGQDFPINGDAKLRRDARLLQEKMNRAYVKAVLSSTYGKVPEHVRMNLVAGYGCVDHMHSTYADSDSISC